ncbi:concanavalin A-like lectin/glucanase, partial [Ramicandelaber brevisporus]
MRIVSTLGLLLVSLAAVRAECGKGVKCGEGSPCCREGWCDSKASFCMAGYCDPVHSFSPNSCWPRPACIDQSYTFGGGGFAPSPIRWTLAKSFNGDPNTADWIREFEPDHTEVNPATGGMVLYMTRAPGEQKGFGATVSSTRWVEYGKVTARLKSASHGKGPVSAFILKGSEGDEIDIAEIVGLERDRIQTNFYYDGIEDYTHMVRSPELAHTDQAYYDYGVDWKPDSITWLINGQPIRVLRKADTWDSKLKVFKFPSRPARIQFSVWDGGNSGKEGTMKWAGTPTEWDKFARFEMEIAQVSVECYYKGNST